jgi:hypothetical protein
MFMLPSYAVLFLPLVVMVLSGWFCHKPLSPGFNAIIFLAVAFGCALFYIRAAGPLIGGQVVSIMLLVAYSGTLMAVWPIRDVYQWLVIHMTSPFTVLPSINISIQPRTPAEQRNSLLSNPQWQQRPMMTPVPSVRDDETSFHRERTSPIPAMPPPQPSSRPLTLTPPPYQQERVQP